MRLVIFDCDGTLVDSQHLIVEAMGEAFASCGFEIPERARILEAVGLSVEEAMLSIWGEEARDQVPALSLAYREAFGRLRRDPAKSDPLYSGAREALHALREAQDVLLGIATGKSRRGVRALLEREGFEGFFATVQTADDAPSKPNPAMIHQAMRETGVEARDTVMIGDTSYDMTMARAADVFPIGVSWGYHETERLAEAGAAVIAHDFPDLMRALSMRRGDRQA